MVTKMILKGKPINVESLSCVQLASNHYEISGTVEGLYNSEDIDAAEVHISNKKARQVLYSYFQQNVRVGEAVRSMFIAQVLV